MHGRVILPFGDSEYAFRLTLDGIDEIEQIFNRSIFAIAAELKMKTARTRAIFEIIRVGLIGGGMPPLDARAKVAKWSEERPIPENEAVAYQVALAGLMRVHSAEFPPLGEPAAPTENPIASTSAP